MILARLRRVEGQIRGVAKMIEGDRYCLDVVDQIGAVIAGLRKAEREILMDHIETCVEEALQSGDKDLQRKKVGELVRVLSRDRAVV